MPGQRVPKSITIEKKEVLDWIDRYANGVPSQAFSHFAAKKGCKISAAQIRYWYKNREAIRQASSDQLRLRGAGARPRLGEIEDMLFDEIVYMHSEHRKVSRQWIQAAAVHHARTVLNDDAFATSERWLSAFMHQYGLSLRRTTNLTTLTDVELVRRAVRYMAYLTHLKPRFDLSRTILMDETAVYFEDTRCETVDIVGSRHVVLRSTGFASMRVTAMLAVTADGAKLPPLVIWKNGTTGISSSAIDKIDGVYVVTQKRAWVDSTLLQRRLGLVFPVLMDHLPGKALVWDSMSAHILKAVKARCAAKKIDMVVVPGGCTPYLQAGDIGIYKSFKYRVALLINEWNTSDRVEYTRGGNLRPPSVSVVAGWVKQAWQCVPDDVISKSIGGAGFNNDYEEWHVAKHDIYGDSFCAEWILQNMVEPNREEDVQQDDASDGELVCEL